MPGTRPLELDAVDARLRSILRNRCRGLVVREGPAGLTLEVAGREGTPGGFAAGTRVGKRYVSYYLMPVYAKPELLDGISPELQGRMQGKSCFNFSRVDEGLFAELDALTERCFSDGPVELKAFPEQSRRGRAADAAERSRATDARH